MTALDFPTMKYPDISQGTIGAIGELAASAYLMKRGFCVYRSESMHAPFDLVAYRDGQCYRVEVKTVAISASGNPSYNEPKNDEWDWLLLVDDDLVLAFSKETYDRLAAKNAILAARGRPPVVVPVLRPCGTTAAYSRHRDRNEPACDPCLAAIRAQHAITADRRRVKL